MTKKTIVAMMSCLIISVGMLTPANAATIELTTSSSVEPIYSLDIIAAIEPTGLYGLGVGDVLGLSGLGDIFAGDYYISAVDHSFSGDGYTTHFTLDRPLGFIADADGNTDISLTLLNYEFTTFEIVRGDKALTEFTFVVNIPEPSTLILFAAGLFGMVVWNRKQANGLA